MYICEVGLPILFKKRKENKLQYEKQQATISNK